MIKEQGKGGSSHNILARKRILHKNRHHENLSLEFFTNSLYYIVSMKR